MDSNNDEFKNDGHDGLSVDDYVSTISMYTLHDEGRSEYNFGYHPKNHLVHTLCDQNQPLFKSPRGRP